MIKFIQDIQDEAVGGKAKGLQMLRKIGLNVPDAFVLIHPRIENLDEARIQKHLHALGEGCKAVRSSAVSEDGANASFAGQFETFLNLRSYGEIKNAIINCIEAAQADRVRSYSGNLHSEADLRISVILQNMVDARIAGVVFSINPVNNRHDTMVINAIAGNGEQLVSGQNDAVHYELFRSGKNLDFITNCLAPNGERIFSTENPLLTKNQLLEIMKGARLAELHHGVPVDLEWAIDQQGILHWLQVRPITTINEVHYNELDSVQGESSDVWTLGNIGEMMPGVATPLTWSVSAEAIDYGMTVLADKVGAFKLKNRTTPRYIQMFYNRLFINMSNMMDYPKHIWMNKPEDVQFALSGKVFPGIPVQPESSLPRRILNFFRQIAITFRAKKHLAALKKLSSSFQVQRTGALHKIHENLGEARSLLGIGFGHHLMTSAQSGTLYSAIMRIMTGSSRAPSASDHHIATILLLNIPEIESADAVKTLERFANLIKNDVTFADRFLAATPDEALTLLQKNAPPDISGQFRDFISRHGHRCVRESELREQTWEERPQLLIKSLQTRIKFNDSRHVQHNVAALIQEAIKNLPRVKQFLLRMLVPLARKAVARREITKADVIRMVSVIRKGYRELALRLAQEGLLDDPDQIYFLTHEEIGLLISDPNPRWKIKAGKRRNIFPELDKLVFEEVSFGIPEPLEQEPEIASKEGQLQGIPVSSGIIEGRAHIVNTLADAEKLREGEIMVASFTDIGWTPYFSIIAGLITEIGSPLSHGAVVAREYRIPAVVSVKGARRFFNDGELIRLDGNRGIVEKMEG